MRKKIISAMLICAGFPVGSLYAVHPAPVTRIQSVQQNGACTGVVKDASGEAVIGASVTVDDIQRRTIPFYLQCLVSYKRNFDSTSFRHIGKAEITVQIGNCSICSPSCPCNENTVSATEWGMYGCSKRCKWRSCYRSFCNSG